MSEEANDIQKEITNSTIEQVRRQSKIKSADFRKLLAAERSDYAEESFDGEDQKRDNDMITSADLLDLYLLELNDSQNLGPGIVSRRTEYLLKKVNEGLIKGLDINTRVWSGNMQGQGAPKKLLDTFLSSDPYSKVRKELESANDPQEMMTAIDAWRDQAHHFAPGTVESPIRDLYWVDKLFSIPKYGYFVPSGFFFNLLANRIK